MTQTNKTYPIFLVIALIAAVFATSAHADSFVNSATMDSLKGFTFGQAVSSAGTMDNAVGQDRQGDSFVSDDTMAMLEDFRFGESLSSTDTAKVNAVDEGSSQMIIRDSFVDTETLKQFDAFPALRIVRTAAID